MLLTLESMALPVCLLCPERPLWPPHPPTRCHYLSAYHLGISYHVLPTRSLCNASLGLILSNIWDSLSIRRELILNFPSDVWTSLLICATLPGHPLPSLLQLQGSQKQECEGVSILRIANHRAMNNTPIAGMSSGWCTGSSTHSLLHLNQSWIHSLLSGKKKQRHNEGREGGKCFFQASFLQRGQDGLAALLGGTGYKRVRGYIQKVTIPLLIIRMWWLICNMCSTSDADYSDFSDYTRWLHPFLCDKEEEIDAVLQRVKEQVDI